MATTTLALDISTTKVGIAVFHDLECIDCTVIFLAGEQLEAKARQFLTTVQYFLDKHKTIDIIAYEAPLLFIRGASTANVVTKLASFNLLIRWLVWNYYNMLPTLVPISIATYKAYFNKTVFTTQELADNTIANLSQSKMYNLAVVNRLFKQHAPAEYVTKFLTSKNSRGGAARGVDDAADAIVVGFYSVLHDGKCQPQLKRPKRISAKRTVRSVRRTR